MDKLNLSHPQPNDILPRNILTFRTITTMLARIQQERPFKISLKDSKIIQEQQNELKISNALANLAVTDVDVVAVATEHSPKELNIVACHYSESDDESPPSPSKNGLSRYWNFLFTKNPRRDEDRGDNFKKSPAIVDAKALDGLDGDESKLWAHVESHW